MAVVGVDEAGKGPVLGSMFAAAVRAPSEAALPPGVDDSKRLSPTRRETLCAALHDDGQLEVAVAEIPVAQIDDPGTDMNTLTVQAHARALADVIRPGDRVLLDAGDTDAARFGRRVGSRLDVAVELRAEHGADAAHAVVGAASVAAKVARDGHVAGLADEHGELGSGYPSDPATRSFLREFVRARGRLPECARTSWATSRDALAAAAQSALDEF